MLELQSVDLEIMQAKKKRAELPQRVKAMMLRKKRAEIESKLEQVLALQEKAESEFKVLEDEDAQLAEKQQRAQEIIDASGSDYRKVESHSKEMAGTAKRAPVWMQKAKLEWLFRGILQPKRARRLLALPKFVFRVHASKKR